MSTDYITQEYISEKCLGIKYKTTPTWPPKLLNTSGTLGYYYDEDFKDRGTLFQSKPKKENIKNYNDLLKALYWCVNRYSNLEALLTNVEFYLECLLPLIKRNQDWVDGVKKKKVTSKRGKIVITKIIQLDEPAKAAINKLYNNVKKWLEEVKSEKAETKIGISEKRTNAAQSTKQVKQSNKSTNTKQGKNTITINYTTNLVDGDQSITLPANATVKDFKKELFKKYKNDYDLVENYGLQGTFSVIFAGKELLNDIVLKELKIEDTPVYVYVRENKDILLMTAKGLKVKKEDLNKGSDEEFSDDD